MKTALYNPIFINPLAYLVFPLLYDITPESNTLIEPCVFTGTLMVQTSDNTTVRFYKDTKTIDLTEFANTTITISQYTDIGSTVLGRWILGGQPKPEWMKHVVARYSAKGRTNEDANREILPDLSGNGHDIVLKNFGFIQGSGYGLYVQDMSNWITANLETTVLSRTSSKLIFDKTGITTGTYALMLKNYVAKPCNLKITANKDILEDIKIVYAYEDTSTSLVLLKLNEVVSPMLPDSSKVLKYVHIAVPKIATYTIEEIPQYPDALVSDGVDDYGICENIDKPIKTALIDFIPLAMGSVVYDQRLVVDTQAAFNLYLDPNSIAYNARNLGGFTYIDGKLNTTQNALEFLNVRHNATLVNENVRLSNTIYLLRSKQAFNTKCCFYNAILFDKSLTETEIQEVIKYYNL